MGTADFLLSPAAQAVLHLVLAEPTRPFSAAELASASKLAAGDVEQILPHLVASGVLTQAQGAEPAPQTFHANTAFVFYPELRRIAFKSFAAAEPLRGMLHAKFRGSVLRAFSLGEDRASGALGLLLVHGALVPEKEVLDLALRKLLKSGAIRLHVQAHVMSERRFAALKPGDALHARIAADTCVDITPAPLRKAKSAPAAPATPATVAGLLERARRRLSGRAG